MEKRGKGIWLTLECSFSFFCFKVDGGTFQSDGEFFQKWLGKGEIAWTQKNGDNAKFTDIPLLLCDPEGFGHFTLYM